MGDSFEFGSVDQQVRNHGIIPRWKLPQVPPLATQPEPGLKPATSCSPLETNSVPVYIL